MGRKLFFCLRSWGLPACADTTDVSGSGGTGVSVPMWGSRLRSAPAGALCLDKLPESQRSRTTAGEVARGSSEVVQLVRTCAEVRPCYQDHNIRATSTDMFRSASGATTFVQSARAVALLNSRRVR